MAAVLAIPAELLILVSPGVRCWRSLAVESLFKGEREVDLSVIPPTAAKVSRTWVSPRRLLRAPYLFS